MENKATGDKKIVGRRPNILAGKSPYASHIEDEGITGQWGNGN